MISINEVIETNEMIQNMNLDVRTITMGISLLDCVGGTLQETCDKIYDKITSSAKDLVATGQEISKKYGIPIVNKRISVTPIALVGGSVCKTSEDFVQIAKALELPVEEVCAALDAIQEPVSLYDPVYSDGGDPIYIMDQVKDTRNTDHQWLENIALKQALDKLTPREQRIIDLRFFQGKTQMEVADEIAISQAQVSRLEKGALQNMRKYV